MWHDIPISCSSLRYYITNKDSYKKKSSFSASHVMSVFLLLSVSNLRCDNNLFQHVTSILLSTITYSNTVFTIMLAIMPTLDKETRSSIVCETSQGFREYSSCGKHHEIAVVMAPQAPWSPSFRVAFASTSAILPLSPFSTAGDGNTF